MDSSLASLEPYLRRKNYHIINLPAGAMDRERKALVLTDRTQVTKTPQEFEDEVPVLEYSVKGKVAGPNSAAANVGINRSTLEMKIKSTQHRETHLPVSPLARLPEFWRRTPTFIALSWCVRWRVARRWR